MIIGSWNNILFKWRNAKCYIPSFWQFYKSKSSTIEYCHTYNMCHQSIYFCFLKISSNCLTIPWLYNRKHAAHNNNSDYNSPHRAPFHKYSTYQLHSSRHQLDLYWHHFNAVTMYLCPSSKQCPQTRYSQFSHPCILPIHSKRIQSILSMWYCHLFLFNWLRSLGPGSVLSVKHILYKCFKQMILIKLGLNHMTSCLYVVTCLDLMSLWL